MSNDPIGIFEKKLVSKPFPQLKLHLNLISIFRGQSIHSYPILIEGFVKVSSEVILDAPRALFSLFLDHLTICERVRYRSKTIIPK